MPFFLSGALLISSLPRLLPQFTPLTLSSLPTFKFALARPYLMPVLEALLERSYKDTTLDSPSLGLSNRICVTWQLKFTNLCVARTIRKQLLLVLLGL